MSAWVCLMYHDVTPSSDASAHGSKYFSVTETSFQEQLDRAAGMGYGVRSLEATIPEGDAGARTVACSFDDGDLGQYARAFPALAKRGMSATFFITTDWVGRPGFVSWDGLREMKAAGMSLQSHTRSHPFLSELDRNGLREELRASRGELDRQLEQQTTSIALPGGDPPRADLRDLFGEEGYSIVATSRWGVNRSKRGPGVRWIHRCTVRGQMPDDLFARVVEGDLWLATKRQVREGVLRAVRNSLGPTRYARWRRRFLDGASTGEDA